MKSAEYLAINPMGKVPAIRHGEVAVTECAAICAYLADAFPQAGLAPPPGDRLRGPYYRWLFFAAGPWEAASTNRALGFELPADPRQRGMAGYGTLDAALDAVEGALGGRDHLVGDGFTAADLYVGSHVAWGIAFGGVTNRPALARYLARLKERPAAIRAAEIDDGLMAASNPQALAGA